MTTNTKLTQVLEYLIKNDEEKAKELLHKVFIEKARAIHEELMSADDVQDEEMDEEVCGSGDLGKDLTAEIESMEDDIDFEETMTETGDDELEGDDDTLSVDDAELDVADDSLDMPVDDMSSEEGGMSAVEDKMGDLESALAALKAEFDKLDGDDSEEVEVTAPEGDDAGHIEVSEEDSWELDEDFSDLAESLDLEVVERDMLKSAKTAKDAGAASSGMTVGNNEKSPVPSSQTSRLGAKAVETGTGPTPNGYKAETAPKSTDAGLGDNRRKKSTDGTSKVSDPKNTDNASNKMSPLSKGGSNLK